VKSVSDDDGCGASRQGRIPRGRNLNEMEGLMTIIVFEDVDNCL
jgi:hypothetical protein